MKATVIVGFADLNGTYRKKGDVVSFSEPYITRLVEGGLVTLEKKEPTEVEATSDKVETSKPVADKASKKDVRGKTSISRRGR
jgi:hypothetical protein